MEIKYLTLLNNTPTFQTADSDYIEKLQSVPMDEIVSLENTYNGGRPFPVALRELLFLAGNNCYVLDRGLNDTQQQMQESARFWLTEFGLTWSIDRPYYVIDVYGGTGQFLFVYLDEGLDDPMVYSAVIKDEDDDPTSEWIYSLGRTLSQLITFRLTKLLSGYNPF